MKFRRLLVCGSMVMAGIFLPLLLFFKTNTLFGGDAGDLVTAAYVGGVAHPPGYPLYTFIAHLLTKLPILTVAGRVSLLSAIPAALSLPLIFAFFYISTRRFIASIIGVFSFGFTYLFLLLAIIPEVFALHLFFVSLLILLLFLWKENKNNNLLYLFSFTFGLSLTHHHTILFLTPAFLYFLYINRRFLPKNTIYYLLSIIYFLIGLLPYSYVYFAARGNPVINWENPQTLNGFIRLVTRAIYGFFKSGIYVGTSFQQRLFHLILFYETLLIDTTRLGLILAAVGVIYSFFQNRNVFIFLLIGFFFTGPLFLYYASFPTGNNFYLGTIERFYLVPYMFFFMFIVWGMIASSDIMRVFFKKLFKNNKNYSIGFIFVIYPLILIITNAPKLIPLKADFTAEHLAEDVLRTTTSDSLLLLTEDTRLFNTEYVYLTSPDKYDTTLIKFGLLGYDFYKKYFNQEFPRLQFREDLDPTVSASLFIIENADNYTIFADYPYKINDDYKWVSMGILNRLYRNDEELSAKEYLEMNNQLFSKYQDPLSGALGSYKHVMLADVLRIYGSARRDVGISLAKLGLETHALEYFKQSIRLQPEKVDNFIELVKTYIRLSQCEKAERQFQDAQKKFSHEPIIYATGVILYEECFNDSQKAKAYQEQFEEIQSQFSPKLEQL